MNSAIWQDFPQSCADQNPAYCVNLPGHGGHLWDPAWRDLSAWANVCLQQAPARAIWVGWSLGGLVALQAAWQAPERVAALVLMTATPRFVQAPDWPAAMSVATLAQFHDHLLADPQATLERFLALQVRGDEQARQRLRNLRTQLATQPPPVPEALAVGLQRLAEDDQRPRLPDLQQPLLWLFGERDTLVPAGVAQSLARCCPNSQHQIIAGAAHAPFLSHPTATLAAIHKFLQKIMSGKQGLIQFSDCFRLD